MGSIEFQLRPDAAPNTAWTIMELVKGGLYRDTIFHRVVAKRKDGTPFVIQGGDPTGTGSGSAGFSYPLENSPLLHDFGVISIARSTDPNTNGCQIFVGLSREGTKHLDSKYAAFGQAVKGGEVILKIAAVPVGKEDRPNDPPKIKNARLVDAPPYGTGPKVLHRSDFVK
jgi:peptidyl-prolyl cis-trans isomerase B (cyclophilin B)